MGCEKTLLYFLLNLLQVIKPCSTIQFNGFLYTNHTALVVWMLFLLVQCNQILFQIECTHERGISKLFKCVIAGLLVISACITPRTTGTLITPPLLRIPLRNMSNLLSRSMRIGGQPQTSDGIQMTSVFPALRASVSLT